MGYFLLSDQERDAFIVGSKLKYVALPGIAGLLLYSVLYWPKSPVILGMGTLIAIASLTAGGLVGFLFGVPKSADSQKKPPQVRTVKPQADSDPGPAGSTTQVGTRRNTNIEEISDWLTKIIVGLGIYELKKLPDLVNRLSRFLSPGFAGIPGAGSLSIVLVVSFGTAGFLLGYILTVLFLTRAFENANVRSDLDANLKEDVKIAHLVGAVAAPPPAGMSASTNIRDQILDLADRYVSERASRPAGAERSKIMEGITRQMRSLAIAGYSMLDELSKSESAGQRLAAIAFLQVQPDQRYIDWLLSAFPKETTFVQLQIAQALLASARSLSGLDRSALRKSLAELQKMVPPGSDRFRTLQQGIDELQ